jgi:cystathionine beta-lyase/cystathionine gamma-synthase
MHAAGLGGGLSRATAPVQGLTFVVDNTFSPMIISPAKWGADVVVHSLTKFMSGASDIIAGAFMPLPTCCPALAVTFPCTCLRRLAASCAPRQ